MSLTKSDKSWLMFRSAALPLLFIVPFFTNHFYQFACPNPKEFAGPCYSVGYGPLNGWLGFLAIVIAFGAIFDVRATLKRGKGRAEFANTQLKYALLSVLMTIITYSILYPFSEGRFLHLLDGFTPPSVATLDRVQGPVFGVSYPPVFLVIFSMLYLIAPLIQWQRVTKDKSKVAGIKKKELFQ